MTRFCKTHIAERTTEELEARKIELEDREELGPGLQKELARIHDVLAWRLFG